MKFLIIIICLLIPAAVSAQFCKLGDVIVNPDGSKGVIFWVNPDGSGGWMVAMKDIDSRPWAGGWNVDQGTPNWGTLANPAMKDTAGYQNTAILRRELGSGTAYAVHIVDFPNGWYLPAVGQLRRLYGVRALISPVILASGGQDLEWTGYTTRDYGYLSSTEATSSLIWGVMFNDGSLETWGKTTAYAIRPVRTFTTQGIVYDTTLTYRWNTNETVPKITQTPPRTTEYTVFVTAQSGCVSQATKQIFVARGVNDTIRASIRRGETYNKNGFNQSEPGTYTRALNGANGCNSSVVLVLNVLEPVATELHDSFCEGNPYQKHNFTVWDAGIYSQRWTAANGCDSTVTLHLASNPSYHLTYDATIFAGQAHTDHGFNVSAPGTHHLRLQTAAGCDSVFTVNLRVTTDYYITLDASICEGEAYTENNFNEDRTGTYYQHLTSAMGHDSIVMLRLKVNPVYHRTVNGALCPGKTYTEHGFNVSVPGVYHRNLQSVAGCDSSITLNLITAPVYNEVVNATICEGEAYTQNGFHETRPGTHYLRLHSVSGCDSVITLNLTVNPSYYFEKSATICQGESYDFKGMILHETGTYYHNLQTATGCDSIYELNLTVKPAYRKRIDTLICEGTSYTNHGFNESATGTYVRRAPGTNGCDSVFTLELQVEGVQGTTSSELVNCETHEYNFIFDNQTAVPVVDYSWSFGDGTDSREQTPKHRYAKEGNYPVTLTVATVNGCETAVSHIINVPYYANPMPVYSNRKGINNEDGAIVFWTDLVEGLQYKWDLGDGTSAGGYKVEHRYNAEQEYYQVWLTVHNPDDCLMEQEFQLKTFKIIYPPNTFSPNGDGINDVFMKGYRVQILNRNGAVIFKGEDGWDGTRKGEQAAEDTYFYEVRYMTEEGEKTKTGYITLIR